MLEHKHQGERNELQKHFGKERFCNEEFKSCTKFWGGKHSCCGDKFVKKNMIFSYIRNSYNKWIVEYSLQQVLIWTINKLTYNANYKIIFLILSYLVGSCLRGEGNGFSGAGDRRRDTHDTNIEKHCWIRKRKLKIVALLIYIWCRPFSAVK